MAKQTRNYRRRESGLIVADDSFAVPKRVQKPWYAGRILNDKDAVQFKSSGVILFKESGVVAMDPACCCCNSNWCTLYNMRIELAGMSGSLCAPGVSFTCTDLNATWDLYRYSSYCVWEYRGAPYCGEPGFPSAFYIGVSFPPNGPGYLGTISPGYSYGIGYYHPAQVPITCSNLNQWWTTTSDGPYCTNAANSKFRILSVW